MRRTTTLTAAALLCLTVPSVALLAQTPASGAASTCQGRTATIVGSGHRVDGTEGADVIVTNGAQSVHARGGDDLVCISGARTSPGLPVDVRAGDGNDVVDGTGSPKQPVYATLGSGVDTFLGGETHDAVFVEYPDAAGGVDTFRGGGGADSIGLQTGPGAAVIDNAAGIFTAAGQVLAAWSEMEQFWVSNPPTPRSLTIIGSAADERVVDSTSASTFLDVDLGAGDDSWAGGVAPADGSRLAGGAGRDRVYLADTVADLDLDLGDGRLGVTGATSYVLPATDFEDADLFAQQVTLAGTDADNDLGLTACTGLVKARRGDDEVERQYEGMFESSIRCEESLTVLGGPGDDDLSGTRGDDRISGGSGDDLLRGGFGDDRLRGDGGRDRLFGQGDADRLVGGRGKDLADGSKGRDTCRAERERTCER